MRYILAPSLRRSIAVGIACAAVTLLFGCQHSALPFEPSKPPSLADFNVPSHPGVPPLPTIGAPAFAGQLSGIRFTAFQLETESWPQGIQALNRNDAMKGDACAEMLTVAAAAHSLRFSSLCDTPKGLVERVSRLISQLASLNDQDFKRILREQKLARHIDAFSGSDIDRLWAQQILGTGHPYLSLDSPFEGTQMALAARLHAFAAKARITLLSAPEPMAASFPEPARTDDDMAFKAQSAEVAPTEPLPVQVLMPKEGKRLYLLDAPGQVQAQVRLGYALTANGSERDCRALAALLGRSQSGRLFYDLRSQRGLTYGVYGACIDNPLGRTLKFYGASANESAGAFIRGILDHLSLLSYSPAGTAELAALESFLNGQQKLAADTANAALFQWQDGLIRGEQGPRSPTALLDKETLNRFAAEVLSQPPLIVVKGDADVIARDLQEKLPDWQIDILDRIP